MAGTENADVEDPAHLTADPGTEPPAPDPPADAPADDHGGEPADPPQRMIPADVFTRELSQQRARAREAEAARDEHRRKLEEAHEQIRRLQNPGAPAQRPAQPTADADRLASEVEARAARLAFERDARQISEAGLSRFGQERWGSTVAIMESLGLNNQDFVNAVIEVTGRERAHEVFRSIADDPQRAATIAAMSPYKRVAEIMKVADIPKGETSRAAGDRPAGETRAAAEPRRVSRAPNPPPRLEGANSTQKPWWDDTVSDAEFSRGFDENARTRHGRR